MNLLEEAKAGNKDAFEQLILNNQYAIYKTARVFFQEESEINLCLERTFYVSYKEIRSCKSEDNFLVWILNQLILTCSSLEDSKAKNPMALPPAVPFTSYEDYKENSIVEQCISKLEVDLRLPALLYFYIHLSSKDIAKLVRISENDTNKRIEKARESLYEIVKKYNNEQNLNSNNNF
jgi:RNA polymerase sigma-70 factor (ECF subfamily)